MQKKIFATLMATLLFFSCTEGLETEVDQSGSAYGTVTDADTLEPVQGVSVTLSPGNESVITGSDGKYSFVDLDPYQYSFQFIKEGYETNTKIATVSSGKSVQVDATVQSILPELVVSVSELDFSTDKTMLSFDISNSKKVALEWSISKSADWISLSKDSGEVTYGVSSIVVTIDRSLIDSKTTEGNIIISSNAGSYEIGVLVSSSVSQLSVTPESLDFGESESVLNLTVNNIGSTSSVAYTASNSNDWIILSQKSGSVSSSTNIVVSVDRSDLAAGSYTGSINIESSDSGQSLSVGVKMTIASEQKPTVNINDVSSISYSSATCSGAIISIGSAKITKHGFCWSTSSSPSLENGESSNLGDTDTPLSFSYDIVNLSPDTKYYVVAYAQNSVGVTYSSIKEFTTSGAQTTATLTTGEISSITSSSAKAAANITSLGNVSTVDEYGHIWSNSKSNLDVSLSSKTTFYNKTSTGSFNSTIEGLSPNTLYYIVAYAKNSSGISYGSVESFTTLATTPSVTTVAATNIGESSATLGGNITDNGGAEITSYGFVWGLSSSALDNHVTMANNYIGSFSSEINSLTKETTYYYQAYAQNEKGIVYGAVMSFTTSSANSTGTGEDFDNKQW